MIKFPRRESSIYSLGPPLVGYMSLAGLLLMLIWSDINAIKGDELIVLGAFALWRYGWALINYIRAIIYGFWVYPAIRRKARALPDEQAFPDRIFFVIPSYKEEPWVSIESFHSILSNMAELPMKATLVVATGADLDDLVIRKVCETHPAKEKVEVVLQRQKDGKRIAMGHALRAVARRYSGDPNSVCIFMDGDSYLEFETLRNLVPVFTSRPKLGAVTTNERAFIDTNSKLYKDWFTLKFGQRHILFQSHSLSNKVMTLTGRFSVFRTSIVVKEDFIKSIEFDSITHWRHGKFRFLMGDDKSSWFYLLKNRWQMLYLPDIICYSLESRDAEFFQLSQSLSYRWNGNTLRNNARALALGWRTTGAFIYYTILEQRLNMWTSLVGITGAIILALFKSFLYPRYPT